MYALAAWLAQPASAFQSSNSDRESDAAKVFQPGVYKDARFGEVKYRLLKPVRIDPEKRYPIILYVHPVGAKGENNTRQTALLSGWTDPELREKHPFFLIAPQCRTGWQVTSDDWRSANYQVRGEAPLGQRAFLAALQDVIRSNPVDTDRVYLTGVGMGGTAVYEMVLREPGRFAAAAPISGTTQLTRLGELKHLPMWVFQTEKDDQITRRSAEALRDAVKDSPNFRTTWSADPPARLVEQAYTGELLAWLLEQDRTRNDWTIPLQKLDATLDGQMATVEGEVRVIPQKEEDARIQTALRRGDVSLREVDSRAAAKGYAVVIGQTGIRRELWITSAAMPIDRFRTLKVGDRVRAKGYIRDEGERVRLRVEQPEWWQVTRAAPERKSDARNANQDGG